MLPIISTVCDGWTLRSIRTDRFKAGLLSVSATLPISSETAYLNSLLFSVLLRGSQRYPSVAALNRRLDELYGTVLSVRNFYRGDRQILGISADLLDQSYLPSEAPQLLDGVLEVLTSVLFHPLTNADGCLNAHYTESEKQLQCDAIRARKNQPADYATDRCRDLLYAGEACAVPIYGTEEEVLSVTPEQLSQYRNVLFPTLSWDSFYVGPLPHEVVEEALRRAVPAKEIPAAGKADSGSLPSSAKPRPASDTVGGIRRAEEPFPAGQGHLVLGFRTGRDITSPDFASTVVMNELFGVSPSSRLFLNVREKLGLCYSCFSSYNSYKGTALVYCGLENDNRVRAEEEIFRQLDAIRSGDFSEEELSAAKKSLENAYRQLEDSPAALESFFFGRALVGVRDTPGDCRAAFAGVTREDVIRAADAMYCTAVFFLRGAGGEEDTDADDED